MSKPLQVHLFFYTDSIGFPRKKQQLVADTFPWLVKDLLEKEFDAKVYLFHRGLGGGAITDIYKIFARDRGYFFFEPANEEQIAFCVFNIGIVDAAPRPFTYIFKNLINMIPIAGPFAWNLIQRRRYFFQKIHSYQTTRLGKFEKVYVRMIEDARGDGCHVISMMTPLPPLHQESRSPGYRAAVEKYNVCKQKYEGGMGVEDAGNGILLEDGHHLSLKGHAVFASKILTALLAHPTLASRRRS